jgi:biopolymer transport protein ExbB
MRLLLALATLLFSLEAAAWWNEEWTQRKQIVINTTAAGANTQQPLAEVPVLVRLHSGNFPQFLALLDQGADFRFVDGDDVTPLKYHVERFDPVAELAYVWVKAPAVGPQSDKGSMYLYFGNPSAPKAEDAGGTFDVATVAAFHFGEASGVPLDSTAYKTPVTAGKAIALPASLIGGGATLSGTEPLVIGPAPQIALDPATGFTFETWVRLNGQPVEPAYLMDMAGEGDARLSVLVGPAGVEARLGATSVNSGGPLDASGWHHVAVTVLPDSLRLYVDGAEAGAAAVTPVAIAAPVFVGGSATGGGLLAADLDELRISNTARAADWIAFSAKVQGPANDRLLTYGVDASADGEGETAGSFGIIFQNVFGKPEAWVEQSVIVICGLMMLAAAVIMFLRGVALSRAAAATKRFLVAYGGLGQKEGEDDLGALYAARGQFGDSPLWRVYHVGIDEVHRRRSPAVGAQSAGIDEKALASIRAAMDAAMVREGQRLNSQLVLLTIAISGGPFIGLFGTVVGVMVTFAAIAATGDVNIAAIAPGMAAALLATVAGLGVAIPSLFGYNWLSSRAKDQVADMRVFADELVARFSEEYGA